jgi:hypothetical protein
MITKFLLPQTDEYARAIISWSKRDGIASVSTNRMHLGSVREVREENGKIAIIADVTDPELVKWIKENIGEGEPIEIEGDPEHGP